MQKRVIHNSRWKKLTPGTYINRWAPYEKAHGLNQGQLPWRSLRSQEYVISCREAQNTLFNIK